MKEEVIIIGAGGHAKVIIDILNGCGNYRIAGCIDKVSRGGKVLDYPVLGDDSILPEVLNSGIRNAFVAIGDNRLRKRVFEYTKSIGFNIINVVSQYTCISTTVKLGEGIAIMPGVVVNAEAVINSNAIINTGATIDHECIIGENVHIAPGCNLAGNVLVEEGAFLGVGCRVIPKKKIGAWSIVGAGAVVIDDIISNSISVGVPAKTIK